MGKRIEKALVFTIVLSYQLISFTTASAALFDWTKKDDKPIELFRSESVTFHEINNWGKFKGETISEPEMPKASYRTIKTYTVRATGYSSTPDQTDDSPFITASGTHVRDGVMAANFLPFGTKVRIPELYGDKVFVVEDRMNKRYWMNIDIWFPERNHALIFGSRQVIIEVVEES